MVYPVTIIPFLSMSSLLVSRETVTIWLLAYISKTWAYISPLFSYRRFVVLLSPYKDFCNVENCNLCYYTRIKQLELFKKKKPRAWIVCQKWWISSLLAWYIGYTSNALSRTLYNYRNKNNTFTKQTNNLEHRTVNMLSLGWKKNILEH